MCQSKTCIVTSGVGWLRQALDVQSARDVVLYGGPVTPHYRADGFSQAAQVVKDLQGRANLCGILTDNSTEGDRGGALINTMKST